MDVAVLEFVAAGRIGVGIQLFACQSLEPDLERLVGCPCLAYDP